MPRRPPSTAILWAANAIGAVGNVLVAAAATPGLAFSSARFAVGLAVVAPLLPRLRGLGRTGWLVAGLDAASIALFLLAASHAPIAIVAALGAVAPLAAAGANRLAGRSRLSRRSLGAVCMAAVGALGLSGAAMSGGDMLGLLAALGSVAASTAGALVYSWKGQHIGPWTMTAAVNVSGAAVILPLALLTGATATVTLSMLGWALLVVLTGGVLGMFLVLKALGRLPAPVVMAHAPLSTVFTALLATVFLGTPVPAGAWLPMALVLGAGLLLALDDAPQSTAPGSDHDVR